MDKKKIIDFIIELICYEVILVLILLIANKLGWMNGRVIETSISITIGWGMGKVILMMIHKRKK